MSFNTNRWTQKSEEAIIAAQNIAERNSNSQVEPEHLLLALLEQGDGVVRHPGLSSPRCRVFQPEFLSPPRTRTEEKSQSHQDAAQRASSRNS